MSRSHARPAFPFPAVPQRMSQREVAAFLFAASRAVPADLCCGRQDMALKRVFKRVRREGLTPDVLWQVGKVLDGISADIAAGLYRPRSGERYRPHGLFRYQTGHLFPDVPDYWRVGAACAESSLATSFPEVGAQRWPHFPEIVNA